LTTTGLPESLGLIQLIVIVGWRRLASAVTVTEIAIDRAYLTVITDIGLISAH